MRELKAVFPKTNSAPPAVEEMEVETSPDPIMENISARIFPPSKMSPSVIDESRAVTIEARTRGQRTNILWCLLHRERISSSNFGQVMAAGKSLNHLIADIINESSLNKYSNLPVQVKWGQDHEDTAMTDYMKFKEATGTPVEVMETGLHLIPYATFLGASCDRIVIDKSMPCDCQKGVLEIKSPTVLTKRFFFMSEVDDILSIPSFYMSSDFDPALCKTHNYYAQVQEEMGVKGLPWCDFVVWTGAKKIILCVQRIYIDATFVFDML
ncbi:hypothetical protein MAR_032168 [Mya arenaria]|uniref:YqaJ viral recombinase domain-containing protein n=1 Tax=Mya arenaria TaxID=6604 RepID=A0ABY7F8T0_MYAAR|nr:hypothetical protein MAR_032168 [Mya arenaria]